MYTKLELWIDGVWRQGSEGKSEPVLNPTPSFTRSTI